MTDPYCEETLIELLRSVERSSVGQRSEMAKVRHETLAAFDEAARLVAGGDQIDHAAVFELNDAHVRPRRQELTIRPLATAAAVAVLIVSLVAYVAVERTRTAETLAADSPTSRDGSPIEVDGSNLVSGLVLDLPGDDAVIERSEPGLTVVELSGPQSPVAEPTKLTLLVVERWGSPLLAQSLPRAEEPTSLTGWLARSSQDLSTFVPSASLNAQASVESWVVTLGSVDADCVVLQPCGVVAASSTGAAVSLVPGLTNELTSVEFDDGTVVLVHSAYPGASRLGEPVGAEIIGSLRFD